MAVALTVIGREKLINGYALYVRHTFSGSYATPGESVNYATLSPLSSKQPIAVTFTETAGYTYKYLLATQRLQAHLYDYNNAADGPTIQIPDAAYPAGITGDTEIIGRAVFVN